jgi:autotransporter-associated beta strand protein
VENNKTGMKFLRNNSRGSLNPSKLFSALLVLLCALLVNNANAATTYYFHINGTGPGYGINANDSLSWDGTSWTALATGAPTNTWAVVSPQANAGFARFNSTTTPYTVTVNNTEYDAGIFGGGTLTINAAGGGNLNIVTTATLTGGLGVQGFFTGGGNLIINAPLTGPGGVSESAGGGSLKLLGNNTYSGGTVFNSSATLTYFNNNNSFGTGPININGTTFAPILGTGGAPITLANNWTNLATDGINFAADPNTPVILTGRLALQTFGLNLRNNADSTSPVTWQGVISGTGGTLNLTANSGGTIILSGANTYTGPTTLGVGGNSGANVTVKVGSLNKVTGGNPSSNLGAPTTVANGTIGMGSLAVPATLIYTGPGETSDRVINLAGTTGGATIQNDGSGALTFSSAFTATGAGTKTLTLQGSYTASANTISGAIVGSGVGVAMAGAGTWKLAGANTYTGGTTVNAGTLEISGSVAGSVTNNAGVLTLDTAGTMSSSATLAISSGSTVNLNFSGTNSINSLMIDGAPQVSGVWGSAASGAPNTSSIFTGTGKLNVLGKPVVIQQPVSGTVYPDQSFTFTAGIAGDLSTLTYQWKLNGNNVAGATDSSYVISPVEAANAGTYSVWVTNAYGSTNSANATLTVLGTNAYTQTVRGDSPISYWRLDETNGTLAYDGVGGNLGQYRNVLLNQPGYSLTDSDSGIGVPGGAGRGLVSVTNYAPFAFLGAPPFALEGWAYFTNLTGIQRLFSTLNLTAPGGWAFGINGNNGMRFTAGAVADIDQTLSTPLVTGVWYHLVCTCDGNAYHFYVNGAEQGTGQAVVSAAGVAVPLTLGCNPLGYTNNAAGDPLGEQVKGRMDEFAVYGSQLSTLQVTNHYLARYGTLATPAASAPVANPPTNYVSLTSKLVAVAAGQLLNYQWYKGVAPGGTLLSDGGNISGSTSDTLTLSPLQLSDAGNYWVQVSNPAGTTNSPSSYLAVLAIPTNASQLNLTNSLVLHLPFEANYADVSGRANNGTNVGATSFTNGIIGTNALHYFSDNTVPSYNYVTLGVRPDLQFGSNIDFTVAFWVRQPASSSYTNLPFFTDAAIASGTGFSFSPYETATTAGGWLLNIGSMSSPSAFTSFPDSNLINDGAWHHLVHSASRSANVITYLDGVQVDSQAIGFLGNINTANPATIGQAPNGTYAVTAQADLDDMAVWTRTLTPLEVSGIYLAGATNGVSFAPPAAAPIVQSSLQIQRVAGQWQITWGGSGGTLQASGDVNGTYTNVPSATSPYTIPAPLGAQTFYRLKY